MRLATLRDGSRDGTLIVVSPDGLAFIRAGDDFPTMQAALDDWQHALPVLQELATRLQSGEITARPLFTDRLSSPLPRAYEWVDGSAYLNHVVLARRARG